MKKIDRVVQIWTKIKHNHILSDRDLLLCFMFNRLISEIPYLVNHIAWQNHAIVCVYTDSPFW